MNSEKYWWIERLPTDAEYKAYSRKQRNNRLRNIDLESLTLSRMKRSRSAAEIAGRRQAAKRLRASRGNAPIRAYSSSMVPMASRGYRPNSIEKKVVDQAVGTLTVDTTGGFTLVNLATLGSDMTNRIGRKINIKSLYVRGLIGSNLGFTPAAAFGTTQQVRMIILFDCQPNGGAPAVLDLLNTASPASQLNLNNRDRFKIIHDKTWTFGPFVYSTASNYIGIGGSQVAQIKKYKKLNLETVFNSTNGGTIADISSGALYVFFIGSKAASATLASSVILSTRVRFIDQ